MEMTPRERAGKQSDIYLGERMHPWGATWQLVTGTALSLATNYPKITLCLAVPCEESHKPAVKGTRHAGPPGDETTGWVRHQGQKPKPGAFSEAPLLPCPAAALSQRHVIVSKLLRAVGTALRKLDSHYSVLFLESKKYVSKVIEQ